MGYDNIGDGVLYWDECAGNEDVVVGGDCLPAFVYCVVYGVVFLFGDDDIVELVCVLYALYRSGAGEEEGATTTVNAPTVYDSIFIDQIYNGSPD